MASNGLIYWNMEIKIFTMFRNHFKTIGETKVMNAAKVTNNLNAGSILWSPGFIQPERE